LDWQIDYSETAKKHLKGLDKRVARRILDYMDDRVAKSSNPRSLGKALHGPLGGYWRYAVGDYRVIPWSFVRFVIEKYQFLCWKSATAKKSIVGFEQIRM
jgi:mRNA interferase RelE/StbE